MTRLLQYAGQAIVYAGFAAMLGYFSIQPTYNRIEPGDALIKLSFAHAARHAGECRTRTAEELEDMAANMRTLRECPRERLPVTVELEIDGELQLAETLAPTGLHKDGASSIYRRIPVSAGRHEIVARLRDTKGGVGFDYLAERNVDLMPGDSLAIDFDAVSGGFSFE